MRCELVRTELPANIAAGVTRIKYKDSNTIKQKERCQPSAYLCWNVSLHSNV